jgi:hypothetical protein
LRTNKKKVFSMRMPIGLKVNERYEKVQNGKGIQMRAKILSKGLTNDLRDFIFVSMAIYSRYLFFQLLC